MEPLLKQIWNEEHFPEEWKKGVLIKIPKKEAPTDCNNYRGITLLSYCQINTLRIIIGQFAEYQASLYVLFVDFERVFDSVDRKKIWRAMERFGIPQNIV